MCAKHYENTTILSKVAAKNVGDVLLRHTVVFAKSRRLELGDNILQTL